MAFLLIAVLVLSVPALPAQGVEPPRLRLFLDCAIHCDTEYLRTELVGIDWVTDRDAADVHVIATSLATGAGGAEVLLEFIGRGPLDGLGDRHRFHTRPDATADDRRRELARVLRLGLVRYLLARGQSNGLRVELDDDGAVERPGTVDRWKSWTFTLGTSAELDAESRNTGYDISGEIAANRTTDLWKIRLELDGTIDRETFELDDGERLTARRDEWDATALVVRSLGARWSAGGVAEAWSTRPENIDFATRAAAAIEFDIYPYAEASRRRLILLYTVGVTRYDYVDETVFGRTGETRLNHRFDIAYENRQPWGSAYLNGEASAFLHDWARNRLSVGGGLSVRLARGLEFEVDASYSRVRDQLSLRKGDATDEEVLLELRELATSYRASIDVGLSYTFGSFLNTIVNPRFNDFD